MSSMLHKLRLILLGVLVALGAGAIAQVGGGSGTSSPPVSGDAVLLGLTIEDVGAPIYLIDPTAAADQKRWLIQQQPSGCLRIASRTDANGIGANAAEFCRTGTVVSSLALAANSITANGAEIATQTSGSFVLTFPTACTTTPSMTVTYVTAGDLVVWNLDTFSCTGDSLSFTSAIGEVPLAIRPAAQVNVFVPVTDNGVSDIGCMQIQIDGSVDLEFGADCGGNWTASGSRVLSFVSFSYGL